MLSDILQLLSTFGGQNQQQTPEQGQKQTGIPSPAPQNPDLSNVLLQAVEGTQGKGMDDDIPATIEGQQPAALSQGEYVIPADVVALLGDGNNEAGASVLQAFLDQIRQLKTGNSKILKI
jgi:hypothetical protein